MSRVYVVGTSVVPFHRAETPTSLSYVEMGKRAVRGALQDAGVGNTDITLGVVGHLYGESTTGQRCLYEGGITNGAPVINVNNNCSSGSTALMVARQMLRGGAAQCAVVLGVEQVQRGKLTMAFPDREAPCKPYWDKMWTLGADQSITVLGGKTNEFTENVIRLFGEAQLEHSRRYGSSPEHLAAITRKNMMHGRHNPNALFHGFDPSKLTKEAILRSAPSYGDLRAMMSSVTANGAAAVVLCTESYLEDNPKLRPRAVEILGQSMATDRSVSDISSYITLSGAETASRATRQALREAGITLRDVNFIELHDCFASNELVLYEALGLVPEGKGHTFVESFQPHASGSALLEGTTKYGTKVVVNASGGLLAKGHPLGATGLAQCDEIVRQLRGEAGPHRQVEGRPQVGLQHNFGIGSACVVTVYRKVSTDRGSKL